MRSSKFTLNLSGNPSPALSVYTASAFSQDSTVLLTSTVFFARGQESKLFNLSMSLSLPVVS